MAVLIKKSGKPKPPPKPKPGSLPRKDLVLALTKKQLDRVHLEILKGTSDSAVAAIVQEEFGVFTDVSRNGMRQFINRYVARYIKPKEDDIRLVLGLEPDQKPAAVLGKLNSTLDIMQEVGLLVAIQKSRVTKLYEREKGMPMLFASLGGEVRTLAALVNQYAGHAFDLGRLHKVPTLTKVTKQGESTFIESTGRDHVMFSLERSKQVEDAASKFFNVINGEVLDVEADDMQGALGE